MISARACPRCQGVLTRVDDIGDTYDSCVQCGHVAYSGVPARPEASRQQRWQPREAADRSAVRRRQIARARARARRAEEAA